MDFRVLGPVEVRDGDQPLPIGGPKQRSILALLIANFGEALSVDQIVDQIYDEDSALKARHSVQTFVSATRKALGGLIEKRGNGLVLAVTPDSIDAVRFQDAVETAMAIISTDPPEASSSISAALTEWRGRPYADVDGRTAFETEIARLSELRLVALDELGKIRAATAKYHRMQVALANGYDLMPPLDGCIAHPTDGAMGYHYFNQELIADIGVDPLEPEAMVYAPGPNGQLQLAAVEWVVPIEAWHDAGNVGPPSVNGVDMHILNPATGWYILHAWVWNHNPSGMWVDWNPTVVCP